MRIEALNKFITLAEELGHVFVATADVNGLPHLAAAGELMLTPEGYVEVTSWFCPATVDNLGVNQNVALVVWDAKTDKGYQLLGKTEKMEDLHMINGYAPEIESKSPVPQVERKLIIKVDTIIDFKHAPHTDTEK
ncbi:MAG: pyridoxamine 5'-phosphate oxidase family protein [Thermodesulfovibrionia bacterium]